MKHRRATRFIQSALAHASRRAHHWYHPERHYMRGPGPKTLDKIGEMLRENRFRSIGTICSAAWTARQRESLEGLPKKLGGTLGRLRPHIGPIAAVLYWLLRGGAP